MRVSDVVKCRDEVLRGEPRGVIYLENVGEPGALEADPGWVFGHTCLLSEERLVLEKVGEKLSGRDSRGSFIVMGGMGSGKSHLLLLAYHLFKYPGMAEGWLKENKLELGLQDSKVVALKMSMYSDVKRNLWDFVFEQLGKGEGLTSEYSPGKETIRRAILEAGSKERPVVVILDEVEPWLNEREGAVRESNRFFLEKLSELACDSDLKLLLFTALRGDFDEPKRTLGRTNPIAVNLSASRERVKVILFRLFESIDRHRAKGIVESYVDEYRHFKEHGLLYAEEHDVEAGMAEAYPFHPFMLNTLSQRYAAHQLYQNTRGLLYLLSALVRDQMERRDLFLLGDVSVKSYRGQLSILDRTLVQRTVSDVEEAEAAKIPYGEEILSTMFFHSLTEWEKGAADLDILLSTFRPGFNPVEVLHSLSSVAETCVYVRRVNGRYVLGEENYESLVRKRASTVTVDEALGEVASVLGELHKGMDTYLLEFKTDQLQDSLGLKLYFTLKREALDEELKERIEEKLRGIQYQNSIIFLTPGRGVDLSGDEELVTAARRAVAARDLFQTSVGEAKSEYERIFHEKINATKDRLKGIEWNIVRWVEDKERKGFFSIRPIPLGAGRLGWTDVRSKLKEVWSVDEVKDAVLRLVETPKQRAVKKVVEDFYTFRGLPVILDGIQVREASGRLCYDGKLGVEAGGRRYFEEDVDVSADATLLHPSMLPPKPGPSPPVVPPPTPTVVAPPTPSRVGPPVAPPTPAPAPVAPAPPQEILLDTGVMESRVGVSGLIGDVERKLLEVGQLSEVKVLSPTVEMSPDLNRVGELGELERMSPAGVSKVEATVKVHLADLSGKELIEWLRKVPSKPGRFSVKGKVSK